MRRTDLAIAVCLWVLLLAGCGPAPEPGFGETRGEPALVGTANPVVAQRGPLCADPQPGLLTDFEVRQPPPLAEPPARAPWRDPVFGTCLVRLTDRQADLPPGAESHGLKNEYARVPALNAGENLILVYGTAGEWFLYDATSLQPLGRLPLGLEPRWDAADPNRVYHLDGTRLQVYDVATGQNELVRDFAQDLPGQDIAAVWTRYEGRPSRDGNTWGLMAEDQDWKPVAFVVFDRAAGRVTVRDVRALPGIEDDVDHVTISPLGTYFLASFDRYCQPGRLGTDAAPCGLMVYDRDLQNGRGLLRLIGHHDVALDAAGREVVIYQDIDTDQIAMLDLASGAVTPLWPIDFSHSPLGLHFSGLAYDRPGWALVSTYSGAQPRSATWMDDQVFAVELTPGGRVVRLAHTHSLVDQDQEHDYWAEPQATVNHDFTRVLFTSNWGRSGSDGVDVYLLTLPPDWPKP